MTRSRITAVQDWRVRQALGNPAAVGRTDGDELRDWKFGRSSQTSTILKHVMLAMIPGIIFIPLLGNARHN